MIAKRTPRKFTRIGQTRTLFAAFQRRHGRKPTMHKLVEFAIVEVKDDRAKGIWRELRNGIANIEVNLRWCEIAVHAVGAALVY
jgi:hypothetical protein